jgi:ubiquinone/menaquinone biosynthesis C-methylase UbiE
VGFYTDQVVPRVTNLMLGSHAFGEIRARVCDGLHGDVLELGFGSGLNLSHLPATVTGLWAVDPSGTAMKLAAKRIAAASVPVHPAGVDGARLELPDDRFDGALSTMTLCTIPHVSSALAELHRVLQPGAEFHFAEHGRAPDATVARTQDRFDGFQQRVAGGCHLNREVRPLLEDAGFAIEEIDNFFLKGSPKAWGYMYVGRARKA